MHSLFFFSGTMSKTVSTKLYVGNLPETCRKLELQKLFENYGTVVECDIVKNYGFVVSIDKCTVHMQVAHSSRYGIFFFT